MKKTIIGIAAAAAAIGIIVINAPAIRDEFSSLTEEKTLSIRLVSDMPDDVSFSPGAEIPLNARIQNDGNESAYVFLKVDIPTVEGSKLIDGTEDTPALLFEPGDGWEKVEDGVYFYEELLLEGEETTPLIDHWTIPQYDLTRKDGKIMTGSITIEEACEKASEATVRAYGIMEVKGTPRQLWEMIGY